MVNQAIPLPEVATGSDIVGQVLDALGITAGLQQNQQAQAGYYPTASLGSGPFAPTLSREQFQAQQQQAAASEALARSYYNLDVERFGLDVANANYAQRLGEAQARLQAAGLMASLSGPQDWVRYNYTLNGLAAPQGSEVDPYAVADGISQPFTYDKGTLAMSADTPRPPAPPPPPPPEEGTAAPPPPATAPSTVPTPTLKEALATAQRYADLGYNIPGFTAGGTNAASRPAGTASGTGQTGTSSTSSSSPKPSSAATTQPAGTAQPVIPRIGGLTPEGYADGGHVPEDREAFMVGEKGPEIVIRNPDGSNEVIPFKGGAAEGGFFGTKTTYGEDVTGSLPVFDKLFNGAPAPAFRGRGEALSGSGVDAGVSPFSYQRYLRLRPSEQAMVQGIYETPKDQGGFGVSFADELQAALAGAPRGASFGATFLGA